MSDSLPAHFHRDMGLTHREFMRTLPAALGGLDYRVEPGRIDIDHPAGTIRITLHPTGERRIAALVLPVTPVEFRFDGLDAAQRQQFMARFERYFHRGGG